MPQEINALFFLSLKNSSSRSPYVYLLLAILRAQLTHYLLGPDLLAHLIWRPSPWKPVPIITLALFGFGLQNTHFYPVYLFVICLSLLESHSRRAGTLPILYTIISSVSAQYPVHKRWQIFTVWMKKYVSYRGKRQVVVLVKYRRINKLIFSLWGQKQVWWMKF